MQTYSLKYEGGRKAHCAVGVTDPIMAVHVLEARATTAQVELWKGETRICELEPCGEGIWLVSNSRREETQERC